MERILATGLGPDLIDLAASLILIVKRAGLLENPGIDGSVISGEAFEPLSPYLGCNSIEVLPLQDQAGAGGIARSEERRVGKECRL